jgi:hypothetical protein
MLYNLLRLYLVNIQNKLEFLFLAGLSSLVKSLGVGLEHTQVTRLEGPDRDKHSNLLATFLNYGRNKFIHWAQANIHETSRCNGALIATWYL